MKRIFKIQGETFDEKFDFLERFLQHFIRKYKPLSRDEVRIICREEIRRYREDSIEKELESFLEDA